MTKTTVGAEKVAPLLKRNEQGIIIGAFGDVSIPHQCIQVQLQAHKLDLEGFVDESEIVRLTVPLTSAVKTVMESWLVVYLPGYFLHDWCVWDQCKENAVTEPF